MGQILLVTKQGLELSRTSKKLVLSWTLKNAFLHIYRTHLSEEFFNVMIPNAQDGAYTIP